MILFAWLPSSSSTNPPASNGIKTCNHTKCYKPKLPKQRKRILLLLKTDILAAILSAPWCPHLWRYGVHAGAVLVALVEDEAQLPEQHRQHPQVLLEFPQPVLVGGRVVSHAVGKLWRTQCVMTTVLSSGK